MYSGIVEHVEKMKNYIEYICSVPHITNYMHYESFWIEKNELSILPPKTRVTFILLLENNKRQLGPLGDRQNFEKLRWEKNRKNFWSRQVLVVLITMKN